MGSMFQNRIKNFERYYGVHLRSLGRSRRFTLLLLISAFLLFILIYKLSSSGAKYSPFSVELESCASQALERYQSGIDAKNVVVYELPYPDLTSEQLRKTQEESIRSSRSREAARAKSGGVNKPLPLDEISLLNVDLLNNVDSPSSRFFLPYTGNGYIGVSITNQNSNGDGLYANYQKTLSLPLMFSPLASLFTDGYERKEVLFVDLFNGVANKLQCYQINSECVSVLKSVYAHRTRPSVLVEEITFNNPTKDAITFDVVQMGAKSWNQSKYLTDNFNGMDFAITNGIIDVMVDNKLKHLCVSIGTTKLANNIRLKEHEFNSRFYSITVVKYSTTFLSGKLENLERILDNLQSQVIGELKETTSLGFGRLRKEHTDAWNAIWRSGFGISHSLAMDALNADRINASIYYVLANHRAPLIELKQSTATASQVEQQPLPVILEFNMERCYEGFSTLHATTLWKLPTNEQEAASLTSLWSLTLQKHGCKNLVELGVDGVLQAVILSLGGLKFTHHHLDLNLNPRQLHRNYYFRNINYANMSLISIDIEVGSDNHAKLYVQLNELIDQKQRFYACDGGCIDESVHLQLNDRIEFPVKLTEPLTAILYISSDKKHLDELKHTLHVKEVDIAPAQDVNTLAIHKHGHQYAGLATLFWTLFVFLIIIFHLFLFKLIYRELIAPAIDESKAGGGSGKYGDSIRSKYQRYARTV